MTYLDKECLFCKFVRKEIPCKIVFENSKVMAFLDINPAGKLSGHTLIIPKKHFAQLEEIEDSYLEEIIKTAKRLSKAIRKTSGAEGINLIQNNGKVAGQVIMHAHFHLIPRKHADGIRLNENRRNIKPLELTQTAKAIKENL
ncbi:MAG: HIT family protein [Candidatus ainarchaeum sp.]|jgi:histidine triad (HIT) family protein|nr:HIT family protein [Candidatus ainarchaeum sp.]MDD3085579.1 HIT family protein [Candidatus ainarchaeum sp.]MDD4128349.1 HIT family protein [Candidatus ainarchaeum sp.]MDD4467853.1 HIT family protein [Candidatus ainarchaeum sp.]HPM85719.1 HIT family protein [archaeon]